MCVWYNKGMEIEIEFTTVNMDLLHWLTFFDEDYQWGEHLTQLYNEGRLDGEIAEE